ncbi:MAG TPA: TIGR03013 family XrtA/PEP-CTERM system glycosyltransferase [candidate division Zixibacteria bacterium]|nr:TIGR03013 family XrtA/PEP-CTERM system glycosyltransferase [candidate division Zixibacteria bacterium]
MLILLSVYLSFAIRQQVYIDILIYNTKASILLLSTYLLSFAILDSHNFTDRFKSTSYFIHFLFTVLLGTIILAIVFYFLKWRFGRGILLLNMFIVTLFSYFWRILFDTVFNLAQHPINLVIIGSGYAGRTMYDVLTSRNYGFKIVGFLDDDPALMSQNIGQQMVIGTSVMLTELVDKHAIDAVVVAVTHEKNPDLLKNIVEAKMKGIEIYFMPNLYEEITGKLPVLHIGDGWLAYTNFKGVTSSPYTLYFKRAFDIFLSLCGLTFFSPIILFTAIAVKLESKGPILYRQKRIGYNDKTFELYKFRSMKMDAEEKGAVWAQENDPRVTLVGKLIRKTRIDEVPQMWNVLMGNMSFIGPRPERPEFVALLKEEIPFYSYRHTVQPGITGWAQVNYQYGASKKDALEKLQYDLYYIKNLSFFLDIHVLLKTVQVVLFGKGAR